MATSVVYEGISRGENIPIKVEESPEGAAIVEETSGSSRNQPLFFGLKLWFSHTVPQRNRFIDDVRANGGEVVPLEKQADISLFDHARKNLPAISNGYSYQFVEKSLRKGALEDLEEYRLGTITRANRPIGSVTVASKGSRIPFTEVDDQVLWNWVKPHQGTRGEMGNKLFQQLEEINPRHTYQSWRDRWLKYVQFQNRVREPPQLQPNRTLRPVVQRDKVDPHNLPPMTGAASVSSVMPTKPPQNQGSVEDEDLIASPSKNEEIQAISATEQSRKQELRRHSHEKTPASKPKMSATVDRDAVQATEARRGNSANNQEVDSAKFSIEDKKMLEEGFEIIMTVPHENAARAWAAMADEHPQHTAREWRTYFETVIFPSCRARAFRGKQQHDRSFIDNNKEQARSFQETVEAVSQDEVEKKALQLTPTSQTSTASGISVAAPFPRNTKRRKTSHDRSESVEIPSTPPSTQGRSILEKSPVTPSRKTASSTLYEYDSNYNAFSRMSDSSDYDREMSYPSTSNSSEKENVKPVHLTSPLSVHLLSDCDPPITSDPSVQSCEKVMYDKRASKSPTPEFETAPAPPQLARNPGSTIVHDLDRLISPGHGTNFITEEPERLHELQRQMDTDNSAKARKDDKARKREVQKEEKKAGHGKAKNAGESDDDELNEFETAPEQHFDFEQPELTNQRRSRRRKVQTNASISQDDLYLGTLPEPEGGWAAFESDVPSDEQGRKDSDGSPCSDAFVIDESTPRPISPQEQELPSSSARKQAEASGLPGQHHDRENAKQGPVKQKEQSKQKQKQMTTLEQEPNTEPEPEPDLATWLAQHINNTTTRPSPSPSPHLTGALPSSPPIGTSPAASSSCHTHNRHLKTANSNATSLLLQALEATNTHTRLANFVYRHLVAGTGIPPDMRGVWTASDDDMLNSDDARNVEMVARKHGWEGVEERWECLRVWGRC